MDREDRYRDHEDDCGRTEVATLSRLLALEREKRIGAERLVEAERQALLQLSKLLVARPSTGRGNVASAARTFSTPSSLSLTQQQPCTATALSSSADGDDDLFASVFSQLPAEAQGILSSPKTDVTSASVSLQAMAAVQMNDSRRLEELLLELIEEEKEQFVRDHGGSLLGKAVGRGYDACVRVLLRAGCHPDCASADGTFPLLSAASNGHLQCIQALLDSDCNLSLTDNRHCTALYLALQHGRQECANKLLDAGAPLDCVAEGGHTVFHAAAITNIPHLLRSLLVQLRCCYEKHTVRNIINHRNNFGYTALHEAAAEGFKECVQVLCACPEVDLSLTDDSGMSAADIATADCSLLITTKGCKEAVLIIEATGLSTHSQETRTSVGRLHILPTHSWEDLGSLVEITLQQYFQALQGEGERVKGDVSGAISLPGTPRSSAKVPERLAHLLKMSIEDVSLTLDDVVKERVKTMRPLTLDSNIIRMVRIGRSVWRGKGEEPIHTTPYNALQQLEEIGRPLEVTAKLKGVEESVFLSLIPLGLLQDYTRLLMNKKALLIHSTPGTDQTPLIKQLINYIQQQRQQEGDECEVVKVPLYSGFSRDSLIALLHDKNLLQAYNPSTHPLATTQRTTVLVMDGMERVRDVEEVFSELFVAMETRAAGQPVWIGAVRGSTEQDTYHPPGQYQLSSRCFILATHSSSEGFASSMVDHFAHVRLSDTNEPGCGLLLRQLMSKLINTRRGTLPMKFDPLYQSVVWIWKIWLLYNHFVKHLSYSSLAAGHKLFLNCPIETNNIDAVHSWLCELWNHSLAPKVEEGVLQLPKEHPHHSKKETARHLLCFLATRVIQLTSPLAPDATRHLLVKLHGSSMLLSSSTPSPRISPRESPVIRRTTVEVASLNSRAQRLPTKVTKTLSSDAFDTDPVTYQTLSGHGPVKVTNRTMSFSGTLRKSLFRNPKAISSNNVKLRNKDVQERTRTGVNRRATFSGVEDVGVLKNYRKMDELFDMLMTAGSHRLDEQRVEFFPAKGSNGVSHHILPLTSSESSLESRDPHQPAVPETVAVTTASPQPRLEVRETPARSNTNSTSHVRSRSLDGVLQWNCKETDMDMSDLFRPVSTTNLQDSSSDSVVEPWVDDAVGASTPKPSTEGGLVGKETREVFGSYSPSTLRHHSHSTSLFYSSTLGCFSESTLKKGVQSRAHTLNRTAPRRRQHSASATLNYYVDAVEL